MTAVDLVGDIEHILALLAEQLRDAGREPAGGSRLNEIVLARFEAGRSDDAFPMCPPRVLWEIRQALGPRDMLVSDVGLHKLWIARMFPAHEPDTVFIANGLAGMGIALPTAIAAKLVHPERKVVTVNGDGGFMMNVQELETAVRLRTAIVNVIWENGQFGSIVWKQDKKFGRHFGTDFANPDFVKLADAFGMPAWRIEAVDDFGPTLRRALDLDVPSLIVAADRLLPGRRNLARTRNGDRRRMSTITATQEQAAVEAVPRQLLIGGEWRDATGGATLSVEDPSTGEALVDVADATPADATAALDACCAVQAEWAAHPPRERGEILRRAWQRITERADELALVMTLEMGKPIAESKAEVAYAAEFFRWFAEEAVRIEGRFATAPNGQGRLITMRQPVGPCYAITPWNFPMAMGTRKIGPAVAAGCTMVIKPAQQTPLSMLALAQILEESGLPAGVLNVITASSSSAVSKPIIADPRLRKLTFTGSTEVGRKLIEQSAEGVLRTSMELGGNAPFLVFADADVDAAVDGAVIAKMRNMGEACTAANRFHVAERVQDEFAEKLAARLREMKVGRGTEEDVRGRPADRRQPARQGRRAGARRDGQGRAGRARRDGARRRGLLLRADRAGRRRRRRAAAQGGDLRPGRAGDRVRRRGGGSRRRERHRVRPGRLRLHVRPQARVPRRRGPGDRHGRPQPGHGLQSGGAVRRRQGLRLRSRGRQGGDRRVPRDQVRGDGHVAA